MGQGLARDGSKGLLGKILGAVGTPETAHTGAADFAHLSNKPFSVALLFHTDLSTESVWHSLCPHRKETPVNAITSTWGLCSLETGSHCRGDRKTKHSAAQNFSNHLTSSHHYFH